MITLTNQSDEPSPLGSATNSEAPREQIEKVRSLAKLVYRDYVNAAVHSKVLFDELEELLR